MSHRRALARARRTSAAPDPRSLPAPEVLAERVDLEPRVVNHVTRVRPGTMVDDEHRLEELAQRLRVALGPQVLLDHDALQRPRLQVPDVSQRACGEITRASASTSEVIAMRHKNEEMRRGEEHRLAAPPTSPRTASRMARDQGAIRTSISGLRPARAERGQIPQTSRSNLSNHILAPGPASSEHLSQSGRRSPQRPAQI